MQGQIRITHHGKDERAATLEGGTVPARETTTTLSGTGRASLGRRFGCRRSSGGRGGSGTGVVGTLASAGRGTVGCDGELLSDSVGERFKTRLSRLNSRRSYRQVHRVVRRRQARAGGSRQS